MSKKLLALVTALVLVLTTVPAFALELVSAGDTYPIDTDITVSFYAQDWLKPHDMYADWTESPFHLTLAEETGVTVEWLFPTAGADATAYTNTLLSDPATMPNIMTAYMMDDAQDYIDRGIIWDLTDYIEEYAPAYWAFLQANPTYDKAMKTDAGQYYTFGFFREDGGWNDTFIGPVIRQDWLDEQGLDTPTTIDELENVIRVFNEAYGAKFTFTMSRFGSTGISGAFGAYGASNMQVYIDNGEVKLAQYQSEWRDYMTWLNKLWEEGLLDQDSLSETDTTIKTKVHEGKVGVSLTAMSQLNAWNNEEIAAGREACWVGLQYPTGNDGTLTMVFGGPGISNVSTVISKQSTDEETLKVCLQFLDYAYTEEGNYFWNFGVQGTTWDFNADGEVEYLPEVVADNVGVNDYTVRYGGTTWAGPCIQATKLLYLKNSQWAIDANDTWFYKNEDVTSAWKWPIGPTFTVAETTELSDIKSAISTYITESFANFISGTLDITDDAVWDEYIATLDSLNVERMLELYQACYDRYLAR